jgi:RNA polymerase sigma-70 factor, ECF subfamily
MNSGELEFALLNKASQGDEGAFRELYDRTHKKVFFYLYRFLGDPNKSEDVLMETFTEVWRNGHKFRGASRVTTWMIAIARNLALNELKKWKRHEDIDNFPDLCADSRTNPEQGDRQRVLREAMTRLSVKHREVLDLVFYHEMDYGEVAEALHIPLNTVKTRVFYAKEALKEVLKKAGVSPDDL